MHEAAELDGTSQYFSNYVQALWIKTVEGKQSIYFSLPVQLLKKKKKKKEKKTRKEREARVGNQEVMMWKNNTEKKGQATIRMFLLCVWWYPAQFKPRLERHAGRTASAVSH